MVDDVSFRCEPGTVTGFLGPNGAGKTTTMRMLCALLDPDAGLGGGPRRRPTATCPTPAGASGSCSTPPRSTAGAAGARRSRVSAQTMGVDEGRVDALLALVGLERAAARKRVRQYSLGMRQRLGIAHALLGDPEVLILDEPANGLDPEGMRWMRDLLRDFADRGGTVLLSSHLLSEVEAIADRLVIIGGGRIVAQGSARRAAGRRRDARPRERRGRAGRGADRRRPGRRARRATAGSSSTPSPRRWAAPRSPAASPSVAWSRPRAAASSSCSST